MLNKAGAILTAFVLAVQVLPGADQREIAISWSRLSHTIEHRQVRMALPNGIRIEGKVVAVEPAQLRLDITRTTDARVQPRGQTLVPRSAVSVLELAAYGHLWRIVGTIAGPLLVAAAAGGVVRHTGVENLGSAVGLAAAGMAGSGIGGYYLGKRADRRIVTLRIVPEQ